MVGMAEPREEDTNKGATTDARLTATHRLEVLVEVSVDFYQNSR